VEDAATVIECGACLQKLRVPTNRGTLGVKCPACGKQFDWTPSKPRRATQPPGHKSSGAAGNRFAQGVQNIFFWTFAVVATLVVIAVPCLVVAVPITYGIAWINGDLDGPGGSTNSAHTSASNANPIQPGDRVRVNTKAARSIANWDHARVDTESFPFVLATLSKADFNKARDAYRGGDEHGLTEMTLGGRIMPLPDGTRLLVLDTDIWKDLAKARLLDGPDLGQIVWVRRAFLRRDSATTR
jgi:hypothetical protein